MNIPLEPVMTLHLNTQPPEKRVDRIDGKVEVHSAFATIQGEGPFAGRPAIFLRLAGCNLQCPGCFGVRTLSKIPYLSRSIGAKVRLDKAKEGDKVLTFNEDLQLVETEVKSLLRRTVTEWVELRIGGRLYDVTLDHPFFTNRGLIEAGDLKIGDDVLEARPGEIISYKKMGDRNPMKDPEVSSRKAANTDYKNVGQRTSATRLRKFASGELIPTFLSLSPEDQESVRKKQSDAKWREKNPNWKGKNPNLLDLQEQIELEQITTCEACNVVKERLLVHHQDGNHDNDERSNLKVWCHLCHNRHHERGYNFWNGKRTDGKKLVKAHNGQRVEKITHKRGKLPVINISCSPYPTYLANGMWVHNCDTEYTSTRILLSPNAMGDMVEELSNDSAIKLVVITGGEPLRQNLGPLISELYTRRYQVQVETNGTLFDLSLPMLPESMLRDLTIVCSPKAQVNLTLRPYITHLKYVMRACDMGQLDGLPTTSLFSTAPVGGPWVGFKGQVYLQPMDEGEGNEKQSRANLEACIHSCMKFGYTLSLQLHKLCGLP